VSFRSQICELVALGAEALSLQTRDCGEAGGVVCPDASRRRVREKRVGQGTRRGSGLSLVKGGWGGGGKKKTSARSSRALGGEIGVVQKEVY